MYISDAPGGTSSPDSTDYGRGCRSLSNAENSDIHVNFTSPTAGTCFLQKDRQYWLNIKPTNQNEPMTYFLKPEGVLTTSTNCAAPAGWSCVTSPVTKWPGTSGVGVPFRFAAENTYIYQFSAQKNEIHVHSFVFPASYSSNYAGIGSNQLTFNTFPRDLVISTTPGSMSPVNNNSYCRKIRNGLGAAVDIAFNGEAGYCNLTKGVQYYLNIKAADPDTPIDYLLVL